MRDPCPKCDSSSGYQFTEDTGFGYCHCCGYCKFSGDKFKTNLLEMKIVDDTSFVSHVNGIYLPRDVSKEIPREALSWLYRNHVYDDIIEHYGICWSNDCHGAGPRLVVPIYTSDGILFGFEARSFTSKPKWMTYGPKDPIIHIIDNFPIIIVEDLISALRLYYLGCNVLCLRGLSFKDRTASKVINSGNAVILWLDGDRPGVKASEKIKNKLTMLNSELYIKSLWTLKDPKAYTDDEIKKILFACTADMVGVK